MIPFLLIALLFRFRLFSKIDTTRSLRCASNRNARIHGRLDLCRCRNVRCGALCTFREPLVWKAVRQLPTHLQNLYERNGLILHEWNSRGRTNISPASRHRTAHSSRLRYWSNLTILPSHSVPDELVITTTFGTSHGPTQPLIVSWTRLSSPRFRHSLFSHSTGTSGNPRSTLPQQQPLQIVTCPNTRRFVFRGNSCSPFTMSDPSPLP